MPPLPPQSTLRIFAIALALVPFVGILVLCDRQRSRDHAQGSQVTTKQATENLKRAARYGAKAANSSNAPLSTHLNEKLLAAYGKLPIMFEVNAGQMDKRVKFLARGSGYSLFLTSTEAVFALKRASRKIDSQSTLEQIASRGMPTFRGGIWQNREEHSTQNVVRMKLVGADQSAKITGIEELPSKSNYFIGNDASKWLADISSYTKVKYESVYPGVDAIYYSNQGKLEFDFVVAPRASYKQVRLRYEGAKSVRIDKASGDLILTTIDGGELRQHKPVVYQEIAGKRRIVEGGYDLIRKNEIALRIAHYDSNLPLIIDPALVYSTYLGGGADDIGYGVASDSSGNVYIAGRTYSTNFPTANAFRSTNSGLRDIFITKLNPTGTAIIYSTYIGGSGDDLGLAITVNSSGEPYATGWTSSSNFPLANAVQPFYGGGTTDSFLIRLNSTGNSLLTSTYAGGSGTDVGDGVALDTSRNIYGIGYTTSADLLTVNAVQPFNAGGVDAYLIELSASGSSLIFATYAGGSGDDYGNAIAVDSAGYIYAIGDTNSTNLPTLGALQAFNAGGFDAFLGKLTPSGTSIVFSSYAGGSGDDSGRGIAVDGSGNIYAAGYTSSTNLQLIVNAIQPTKRAGYDAFIAKLNSTGSSIFYSTFLGGDGDDGSFALAVDTAGNAYLTGDTSSTDFPVMSPLFASNAGAQDAFITKLNPSGSAIAFSTYLGGTARDTGQAIAVDQNGNAYVTGVTFSSNFPTASPIRSSLAGGSDAFVVKVSTLAAAQSTTIFVEQGTANQAVALDSVTMVRGPFRILTDHNFSADHHTRVILFTSPLGLTQPDSSRLSVTAGGIPLTVENVGTVPGVSGLSASYIVVRLPDGLPSGNLLLTVTLNGVASVNSPTISVVL